MVTFKKYLGNEIGSTWKLIIDGSIERGMDILMTYKEQWWMIAVLVDKESWRKNRLERKF